MYNTKTVVTVLRTTASVLTHTYPVYVSVRTCVLLCIIIIILDDKLSVEKLIVRACY